MGSLAILLLLSLVVCIFFHVFGSNSSSKKRARLPPGPFPLPIIGNIHQLGPNPHRSLANLSKTYGPLMHLKLGSIHTIVASSPEMAKEILQKQDLIFSSRVVPLASEAHSYDEASIAFLPVGDKWRMFRKICKEHIFAVHKMEASEALRRERLRQLCLHLEKCCSERRVVDVGQVAFATTLNLISATLFSMEFASFDSNSAQEMKETVAGITKYLGTHNVGDYFPILRFLDPQGIKRRTGVYIGKVLKMFDEIISTRLQTRDYPKREDFLQVLLDINQGNDSDLSLHDIKFLLMDLITGGTGTTTDLVEWTMTELLRNREKMLKAQKELRTVIGEKKQVEESDISKLPYLQAVIKETFRCHPPAPFFIPHKAEADAEVNGYMVPKDARILVNVWAIGRDSNIWPNPDSFEPERFLGSKIEYKGRDFELIPFGSGRRICPGIPLAHVMVHLIVANLIHNFDWKLEQGIEPEEIDMNDNLGLTLHKAVPLQAFPVDHLI